MEEFHVTEKHLPRMAAIAQVSSYREGKDRWTDLGLYHRQGFNRSFVAVAKGVGETGTFSFRFATFGTIDRALRWFDDSALTDQIRLQAEEWTGPEVIDHASREQALIHALRLIEDGEGDAQIIARDALAECRITTLSAQRCIAASQRARRQAPLGETFNG